MTADNNPRESIASLIIVRGAGDLGSGIIHRLARSGFQVIALDLPKPMAIRTAVSFSTAMYLGSVEIEGVRGIKAESSDQARNMAARGDVAVMPDPGGEVIRELHPFAVVDAILAKKNIGTTADLAPVVIGVGPGFEAGKDVHAVVETNRGHYLGRLILRGSAQPDTGTPGAVEGKSRERVLRSPAAGVFKPLSSIGDVIFKGDRVAEVSGSAVCSQIDGVLRGILPEGLDVTEGFKVGDVDPRGDRSHCFTISDKARAVAGGVLEGILYLWNTRRKPYTMH